jgi:hypothetical protein
MPASVLWAFGSVLGLGLVAFLLAWFGTDTARHKPDDAPPTHR